VFSFLDYVATSISHLVSFEVRSINAFSFLGFFTSMRDWPFIAMGRMEVIVNVTMEVLVAVKPWTGTDEDTPVKPLWTVIADGSTVVGSNIKVTIGAIRGLPNVDSDLSRCCPGGGRHANSSGNS
jgi:hypothetical protein